jgi:hypothetical protein
VAIGNILPRRLYVPRSSLDVATMRPALRPLPKTFILVGDPATTLDHLFESRPA